MLGLEETSIEDDKAGRKEILHQIFPVAQWDAMSQGPVPGIYALPFKVNLPDWLPNSMMLGEPEDKLLLQVKYRLTAQLTPISDEDWVAGLPELFMSKVRAERPIFVNRNVNV